MKEIQPLQINDQIDDLKCINIKYKRINRNITKIYTMQCTICGRSKDMLSPTIRRRSGTTHKACGKGLKTKNKTFYSRWEAMRTRTTNIKYQGSKNYVEKNINSNEFKYFIDFYDAMYESFETLAKQIGENNVSLERLDNDKNYTKENCIWTHKRNQGKHTNKIVTFEVTFPDGHKEIHTNIREFAHTHNLNDSTIRDCISPTRRTKTHKGHKFKRL